MIKAVFLDKDGTLIEDVPYNVQCDRIRLCEGALAGVRKLHHAGYVLVVITNQAGVARGYFQKEALIPVEQHLRSLLQVPIAGFYYCPHHPEGVVEPYAVACTCRKPEPGMVLQATHDLNLDLRQSWLIGDILNDVEAGNRAGCRTILIDNGNETEWVRSPIRTPSHITFDLDRAADFILHPQNYEHSR